MAPLFGYGQSIIDEVYKQCLVEQYIKEHGQSNGGVTETPAVHAQDDAEVTVESDFTDSSDHVSLDQSNDGFSLVNLHWACLLYTSPSPRDRQKSRMPSSA